MKANFEINIRYFIKNEIKLVEINEELEIKREKEINYFDDYYW